MTGVQYGAALYRAFRPAGHPETRASTDAAYLARTAEGYAKAYLQAERWSINNGTRVHLRADYLDYPLPYFGIGPSSADSAEEWYSHAVTTVHLLWQRQLRSADYLIGAARVTHTRPREAEAGGVIALREVAGSRGGTVSALELGLARDSRDSPGAPREGTFARLVASAAAPAMGSDYSFRRLTVDARRYMRLAGGASAAGQVQYDGVSGTVPFDQLPMIGADTAVRGYDRGRYRDRHAVTGQVEVRSAWWRRSGVVLFAGVATVAHGVGNLGSGPWYPTAGAGLRLVLSPRNRTVGRIDLGLGRGSFGVNVGLGEAF